MGLYDRHILPHMVNLACSGKPTMRQRQKIVPAASGRVLEIGFGSGLNLPFYRPELVDKIWALEPSEEMWRLARNAVKGAALKVECLVSGAEEIPLPAGSVDTVLLTYTLCTIPDPQAALSEARRVLAPRGRMLFCEHGEAPDEGVRRWQGRLNPAWKFFGGGCHLDRRIPELIESAGFRISGLETMYLPGWKPASFNYWGEALP
jgi:ubiquinone/menaquinone biosynthesis C-methylase UbiE